MGFLLFYYLDFFREYSNIKGMERGTFFTGIVPSFLHYGTIFIMFLIVIRKYRRNHNFI